MKRISLTGKILFVASALMLIAAVTWAAPIAGVNVPTSIAPFTTFDEYPTHDSNYGKGGVHYVAYYTDLVLIPESRRYPGMLAYVNHSQTHYTLGSDNTSWALFETGGGDSGTPSDYAEISALASGAVPNTGSAGSIGIYAEEGDLALEAEGYISLYSESGIIQILSALAVTGTITENGIDMLSVTDGDLRYLMNSTAGTDLFKLELGGGVDDPTITVSDVGVLTIENLLNDFLLTSEGDVVVTAVQDIRLNGDNVYKNGVSMPNVTEGNALWATVAQGTKADNAVLNVGTEGLMQFGNADGATTIDSEEAITLRTESGGVILDADVVQILSALTVSGTITENGVDILSVTDGDARYLMNSTAGTDVFKLEMGTEDHSTLIVASDGTTTLESLGNDLVLTSEGDVRVTSDLYENGVGVPNITEGNALWATKVQGLLAASSVQNVAPDSNSLDIEFWDGSMNLSSAADLSLSSEDGDVRVLNNLIISGTITSADGEFLTVSEADSTYVADVSGQGEFMKVGTAGAYMTIEADGTMDFHSDLMNITLGAEGEVILETDSRVKGDLNVEFGDVIAENDILASGSIASGVEVEAPMFTFGNGAFITTSNDNGNIVFVFDDGE